MTILDQLITDVENDFRAGLKDHDLQIEFERNGKMLTIDVWNKAGRNMKVRASWMFLGGRRRDLTEKHVRNILLRLT